MDAFNLFFALAKFNQQINSAKCRATFLQGRLKANLHLQDRNGQRQDCVINMPLSFDKMMIRLHRLLGTYLQLVKLAFVSKKCQMFCIKKNSAGRPVVSLL